jgi:hypothetical protein
MLGRSFDFARLPGGACQTFLWPERYGVFVSTVVERSFGAVSTGAQQARRSLAPEEVLGQTIRAFSA